MDGRLFFTTIFDEEWETRELKSRMKHITVSLQSVLHTDYQSAISLLLNINKQAIEDSADLVLQYMFLPDFVETYGMDDFETSVMALREMTCFTSSEFAVRPFLIKYPKRMVEVLKEWAVDSDCNIRRCASEGCRPRLPWAMALPQFKEDPLPIIPILETLKDDNSLFVRKSVANNLNDIAKDNPDLVKTIANKWIGQSKNRDWIVKHGCRTLLKQGDSDIMKLFGFGDIESIEITQSTVITPTVKIGDALTFECKLKNCSSEPVLIRLEYAIYYLLGNGKQSRKVFKISERTFAGNSVEILSRNQSFKIITTRRFYEGEHAVAFIVNGVEQEKISFILSK